MLCGVKSTMGCGSRECAVLNAWPTFHKQDMSCGLYSILWTLATHLVLVPHSLLVCLSVILPLVLLSISFYLWAGWPDSSVMRYSSHNEPWLLLGCWSSSVSDASLWGIFSWCTIGSGVGNLTGERWTAQASSCPDDCFPLLSSPSEFWVVHRSNCVQVEVWFSRRGFESHFWHHYERMASYNYHRGFALQNKWPGAGFPWILVGYLSRTSSLVFNISATGRIQWRFGSMSLLCSGSWLASCTRGDGKSQRQ